MVSILVADAFAITAAGLVFTLWKDNHEKLMEELNQL